MQKSENSFFLRLKNFNKGFSFQAALNSLTQHGDSSQASAMSNVDVLSADYLTQGPALADLTNGNQAAVVYEVISYIFDRAVSTDTTYGIGATKLFQISSTTVTSNSNFPHIITSCTDGESVALFKGTLLYFFNKSSGGDIGTYDLSSTFDDDWGSTVPTGAGALQKAAHPSATKEDLVVFGNGRYVGTYTGTTATLALTKLDFGNDAEVVDVAFNGNQWILAVNSGVSGTNKNESSIFLWGGAGINSILDDQLDVGPQKIGFVYPVGGVVYVAYQDLTTTAGYKIGYISGRKLKALGYFTGSLPNFAQKTMYKDTIIFLSNGLVYSCGASTEDLPIQLSQLADGGYATCGALAAPFGTPMIASTDGASNFRLAKFSGYDTACTWRNIVTPLAEGRKVGTIDTITVLTKTLGASARCDLIVEYNQASSNSSTKQITTTGKRRHLLKNFALPVGGVEDFRIFLNWANGSASNDCAIREIQIVGHYIEK